MAHPLVVAGATRPYPGEDVNGDGWSVQWHEQICRIAVIDGLGHGAPAAQATRRALDLLAARPALAPVAALEACHQALLGTRGAAMAVVSIDVAAARLQFAGLGNVEARLWQPPHHQRFTSSRGIVGGPARTVRAVDHSLPSDWLLCLHSDGILGRFSPEELPEFSSGDPPALAAAWLRAAARPTDDATVVVVRPAAHRNRRVPGT